MTTKIIIGQEAETQRFEILSRPASASKTDDTKLDTSGSEPNRISVIVSAPDQQDKGDLPLRTGPNPMRTWRLGDQ